MITSIHVLVTGRVQGVSFRRFTSEQAQQLQLTGWVRNLKDGRVESIATGDLETLDAWYQLVSQGPSRSRVDNITRKSITTQTHEGFEVLADA